MLGTMLGSKGHTVCHTEGTGDMQRLAETYRETCSL